MKLLIILPSENRGGAEEYALTIANAITQKKGWDVYAAFPHTEGTTSLISDFTARGISYHPLNIASAEQTGFKVFKEYLPHFLRTIRLLIDLKPDVIHIVLPWPYLGEASILACGLLKIPTLVVFQLIPRRFNFQQLRLKSYGWAAARNQQWIAVSENNRKFVCDSFNFPQDRVLCIYNGTDINSEFINYTPDKIAKLRSQVRQEIGLSETTKILLTVGRLSIQKGHQDLVKIIPKIEQEFPDIKFVWIGEGELRESLLEQVKDYGIEEKILFLGYRSDVPRWLKAADLFIFPTHFEGQPFALSEAMAHGLPVISSDASGIPEMIENKVHGLLYPTGNSIELLEAIRWAIRHSQEMQEMAKNAMLRVKDFSKDKMVRETLNVMEKLCKKNNIT